LAKPVKFLSAGLKSLKKTSCHRLVGVLVKVEVKEEAASEIYPSRTMTVSVLLLFQNKKDMRGNPVPQLLIIKLFPTTDHTHRNQW
jgi:hypothetical protein